MQAIRTLLGQDQDEGCEADTPRSIALLEALVDALPLAVVALDTELRVSYWNAAAEAMFGWRAEEVLGQFSPIIPDDLLDDLHRRNAELLRGGKRLEFATRRQRRDGTLIDVTVSSIRLQDEQGNMLGSMGLIEDTSERRRIEERRHFLAEASAVLASSLDFEVTLTRVAELAVPRIADMCTVCMLEAGSVIRRLAVVHADPGKQGLAAALQDAYPPGIDESYGVPAALRTGQTQHYTSMDPVHERMNPSSAHGRILDGLDIGAAIFVPLIARGRTLGALAFVSSGTGQTFNAGDIALAEELAQRAGLAIDNAQLYRDTRAAEERFRSVVEQMPGVIDLCHPGIDSASFYVSPQITALLGYTPEEWIADASLWEHSIHPDDRVAVAAELERVMAAGQSFAMTYRMCTRTGQVIWIRDSGIEVPGEDGHPYWQAFLFDVTEQEEAKQALADTEQRFRTLVEQSPAVVYSEAFNAYAPDALPLYISPGIEHLTGYTVDEWLRDDPWESIIHPDDRDRVLAADAHSHETRELFSIEYRLIAKHGRSVWVREEAVLLCDEDGNPTFWQGVFVDLTEQKLAEDRLRDREARFRSAFDDAPTGAVLATLEGKPFQANVAFCEMLGYTEHELLTSSTSNLTHPDDLDATSALYLGFRQRTMRHGELENRFIHRSGRMVWTHTSYSLVDDAEGQPAYIVSHIQDITERKRAEETLRDNEARKDAIFNGALDAIVTMDGRGHVAEWNPAAETLFGYTAAYVIGRRLSDLIIPQRLRDLHESSLEQHLATGLTNVIGRRVEMVAMREDGTEIPIELAVTRLEANGTPLFTGFVRDITNRKALEAQLMHQAFHDVLTGLPNRGLLLDRIDQAITHAARHGSRVGLLFLDLDNFKIVNDSLGHAASDRALTAIANRLVSCLRSEDTVARFGGDEFVMLLQNITEPADMMDVVDRIKSVMAEAFDVGGHDLIITTSIGLVLSEPGDTHADELLRRADIAMYRAKTRGKNRYDVFDADLHAASLRRFDMEASLRRAVDRDEFVLHYQPKVNLTTGEIVAQEALIRWQRPGYGLVPPGEFIGLAEETGLIVPIGFWALSEACQQAVSWQIDSPGTVVSVNLSMRQFQEQDLAAEIERTLTSTGLPGQLLMVEITESVVMDDVEATIATLAALKALGVGISIDDFGTGYSSLAYLKRLPVDMLKIDRSFVHGLSTDAGDAAIVSAAIGMAHALGLKVVAEGIETEEQVEVLRALHCDIGQRFYFGRPVARW